MENKNNTISILSLIFGIIGLILSFLVIGIVPCIAGLVLGIISLMRGQNKGMSITGIVCSSIGIVVAVLVLSIALLSTLSGGISADTSYTPEVSVEGTEYSEPSTENNVSTDWAASFTPINDFRYTLDKSNHSITLIRYGGNDTQILLSPTYNIDGNEYTLTSMGDDACFLSETSITSVFIPEGVTEIGSSCFNSCSSLERIYLPSTITYIPDGFLDYLGDYEVFCNSTVALPSDCDMNDYDELVDDTTDADEMGESFARAINGMMGGANQSNEDPITVSIYYGGTDEQWNSLVNE